MSLWGGHEGCAGSCGATVGQPQQPQQWLSLGGTPGRQKQTASGGHGKQTRGGAASFAWQAAKFGDRVNTAGSRDLGISSLFPWPLPAAPNARGERRPGAERRLQKAARGVSQPRRDQGRF